MYYLGIDFQTKILNLPCDPMFKSSASIAGGRKIESWSCQFNNCNN